MDVSSMGLLEDSLLWAFDGQLGRLTFFDANGSLVRTVRVMAQTSVHVLDVVDGAGAFGEAMVSTATPIDARIPVWLFTLEGRNPRTLIDRKQNGSVLVRVAEGRRGMSFRNPYASPPMAVATGDRLVLYESDESSSRFFLRWINAEGDTVGTLEQPYRPVTAGQGWFRCHHENRDVEGIQCARRCGIRESAGVLAARYHDRAFGGRKSLAAS